MGIGVFNFECKCVHCPGMCARGVLVGVRERYQEGVLIVLSELSGLVGNLVCGQGSVQQLISYKWYL